MTANVLPEAAAQKTVIDGQIYNVHCASSSDFVVGRQTNFHAPVTIINCPTPKTDNVPDSIVIRDNLWAANGVKSLQSQANSNEIELAQNGVPEGKDSYYQAKFRKLGKPWFLGVPFIAWLVVFILILSCTIAAIVEFPRGNSDLTDESAAKEKIGNGNHSHIFYEKKDWGGLPAASSIDIKEPTPYVVISHTAGPFCYETKACQEIVREIQKDHLSRNPPFADVGYNFLVGGDGYIYEGRGWGIRSPHGSFVNNKNIGIVFIGDFSVYDEPTPIQVDGVQQLLEWGVRECRLSPNYILIAHSALTPTLSPGKKIMEIISTWDHFEANPKANLTKLEKLSTHCHQQPRKGVFHLNVDSTTPATD